MSLSILAVSVSLASLALAEVTPTAPGPNQTFVAGSNCTIQWNADTSGAWTNMTIDLMSGSNGNMSAVTTVASGLDGTNSTLSPYNWTCPEVDPYSAIYFYQFTNGGDNSSAPQWTTRFTIASSANVSVAPEYSQQPNGDPIAWGIGILASSGAMNSTSNNSTGNSTAGEASSSSHSLSPTSTDSVMATASQADQSATPTIGNVNVASANSGGAQGGKGTNDRDSTDNDDDGGDDDDDDDDDGDDDGDDDDDDGDDDGDEDDGDDDGDYTRDSDAGSGHHSSSSASGESNDKDGSSSDAGNDGTDGDSKDSGHGHDSDDSGNSTDDAGDGDDGDGMFTISTRTFHHMRPTQTPDSQGKDAPDSKTDGNGDDNQDDSTSDSVTSSRMERQHTSKVSESTPSPHSGHPRPSATGTLDPTLSMPARFANTDSQAQGSATASTSGAETTANTDGLGDTKLSSAGAPGFSAATGPAWLYLVLAAAGIVPQVVGH